MTERTFTLLFLGVAILGVAVALHRQRALSSLGLGLVTASVLAVEAFLILTYS